MADFIPSGFGPADQLQMILARKSAERHQALLEAIAQQDADTRRKQADSMEAERQGMAERYKSEANRNRLSDYVAGQDLSPEDSKWMDEAGFSGLKKTEEVPGFLGGGDVGPTLDTHVTYKGSPKEQAEQKATAGLLELQKNPEFQKADRLTQALMLRQVGVTNPEPFLKQDASDQDVWVYDESTGKPTKLEGPNAKSKIVMRPRPPQGPADTTGSPIYNYDDKGNIVSAYVLDRKNNKLVPVEVPQPIRPRTAVPKEAPTFDESQMANLQRAKAARAAALKGGATLSPEQAKAFDNAEQTALMQVFSSYHGKGLDPKWQRNLLAIRATPGYRKLSVDQLIKKLEEKNPPFTPEEIQIIQDLFPLIQDH
jgi:hypothetical protein